MKTSENPESLPECERCGYCCSVYSLEFDQRDLQRWWLGEGSAVQDLDKWNSAQADRWTRDPCDRLAILDEWLLTTYSVEVPSNLGTYPVFRFISFVCQSPLFGDLWFHPETRDELRRCPFLRKVPNKQMYRCTIFGIRPEICRQHPGRCPEFEGKRTPTA